MHKRTSQKVFARAKALRRKMTSTEIKLWARSRAHRMTRGKLPGDSFVNQFVSLW